jgi:hypothetical protein
MINKWATAGFYHIPKNPGKYVGRWAAYKARRAQNAGKMIIVEPGESLEPIYGSVKRERRGGSVEDVTYAYPKKRSFR